MKRADRPPERLQEEVLRLRKRLAELETLEGKHAQVEKDLTEPQEELEQRERFLSNVFSSIQDGISILDKDLNGVVGSMEGLLRRLVGENVELEILQAADTGRVRADPGQLEQVILNLAVNGRDAMPQGGTLILEVVPVCVPAPGLLAGGKWPHGMPLGR